MTTTCKPCQMLRGITQCNTCRTNSPSEQTLTRRRLGALMAQEGMTPAQAEAHLGVRPGARLG